MAVLLILLLVVVAGRSLVSGDATPTYDFDKMSGLVKRLDVLESTAPETILGFYESRLKSFSVKPGAAEKRVCVTSTCYALLTIILCSGVYKSIISLGGESKEDEQRTDTGIVIPVPIVMKTLLKSQLREDDLFQVPLVLYSLLRLDADGSLIRAVSSDDRIAKRLRKMISVVLKACPEPRLGARQPQSNYITYQLCKVVALLYEFSGYSPSRIENSCTNSTPVKRRSLPKEILPEGADAEFYSALLACSAASSQDLCRQLAYHAAADLNSFDVIRLAYSLLTLIRSTSALSGSTGRELAPGQGPAPDTYTPKLNKRLVAAALKVFFEEQNKDGLWAKGQPIYKNFRRQGRNMGNAFVFPLNTLGSLLCSLPAEDFRPYLGALENSLDWIENHQTVEMITDYCDPETGHCYGKPIRGWCSPHASDDPVPQAWPTAQVLKCASWMKSCIKQLMHNDVLEEFNGVAFSKTNALTSSWDRLLDSDIDDPSTGSCRTLKSVLEERVIFPFATSIDNPSYGAAYSAILFGMPGTAKTSICEALAQRMGWDFCVIDTASFLADGLTNVAARIRYVFSRLMALNECVILFDEIEEFGLDRETPGLSMESRMLTTAMLTAINDLRRNKRSVFFIATNRLRAFDSAITRRGRFDMHLFVGAPNLSSRVTQFQQQLASLPLDKEDKKRVIDTYRTFLETAWSDSAMFMTYFEGMQFAAACAHVVASRGELSPADMSSIFKQQTAVMSVRGSAREEYLASMGLSRL